jgi:hypothetical protein
MPLTAEDYADLQEICPATPNVLTASGYDDQERRLLAELSSPLKLDWEKNGQSITEEQLSALTLESVLDTSRNNPHHFNPKMLSQELLPWLIHDILNKESSPQTDKAKALTVLGNVCKIQENREAIMDGLSQVDNELCSYLGGKSDSDSSIHLSLIIVLIRASNYSFMANDLLQLVDANISMSISMVAGILSLSRERMEMEPAMLVTACKILNGFTLPQTYVFCGSSEITEHPLQYFTQMVAQITMHVLDSNVLRLLVQAMHAQMLHDVELPSLDDCLDVVAQHQKEGGRSNPKRSSRKPLTSTQNEAVLNTLGFVHNLFVFNGQGQEVVRGNGGAGKGLLEMTTLVTHSSHTHHILIIHSPHSLHSLPTTPCPTHALLPQGSSASTCCTRPS